MCREVRRSVKVPMVRSLKDFIKARTRICRHRWRSNLLKLLIANCLKTFIMRLLCWNHFLILTLSSITAAVSTKKKLTLVSLWIWCHILCNRSIEVSVHLMKRSWEYTLSRSWVRLSTSTLMREELYTVISKQLIFSSMVNRSNWLILETHASSAPKY